MKTTPLNTKIEIYTVSRLNNLARLLLEDQFGEVWVEGEISNFAAPSSGHWYFSLKDAGAQVRCAMFRGNQRKLGFNPKDGMHVLINAKASLYENRGEYQLIAQHMEERGEGKLQRAFEVLKKKLDAQGLFAADKKKSIPVYPKAIGVITSSTGAAIRDILNVLKRRFPIADIFIYPTLVQGDAAAATIARAIETANMRKECDVIILARGGGSLEDLWPFNEEIVAQAIFKSELPIISGVGHEVDFTIADFVADLRAPTPSAAAELATPDKIELLQLLARYQAQLTRYMHNQLQSKKQNLSWMEKHLSQQHPKRRLQEKMQRIDFAQVALNEIIQRKLNLARNKVNTLSGRLDRLTPLYRINKLNNEINQSAERLKNLILTKFNFKKNELANSAAQLHAISPLATLHRGYAIATKEDGQVIRKAADAKIDEIIKVRLETGGLNCKVIEVEI